MLRISEPRGSPAARSTVSPLRRVKRICPLTIRLVLGGSSRSTEWAVTLLPQPDSPTTPTVSPGLMSIVTPSTARTTPSRVKKWVLRLSISSKAPVECVRADSTASGIVIKTAPGHPGVEAGEEWSGAHKHADSLQNLVY